MTLTYLLTRRGGVRAEFTLTRLGPERFYLVSAGALESARFRCADEARAAATAASGIDKVTTQYGVLVLAGPRSREVLAKVADIDVSSKAFPWLTARPISVGAAGALALRVNFVGELGYEIHHPIEMQNYIFDQLMAAGAEFDIKPFGIRAMDSLRLEKSYKLVGRELSIEYAALESGLDRFVDLTKGDFLGRDALLAWQRQGLRQPAGYARASRRRRRRRARFGAGQPGRRLDRAHHLGRLWLADGQVAGARHGQAGVFRGRNRGRDFRPRRAAGGPSWSRTAPMTPRMRPCEGRARPEFARPKSTR